MPHSPKVIFFDLDETLINNHIPVRELLLYMFFDFRNEIGRHRKNAFFYSLKSHSTGLWERMFDSTLAPEQQLINCFTRSITEVGATSPQQAPALANRMFQRFIYLGTSRISLHPEVIDTLMELKQRGIQTGLITNGVDSLQLGKARYLGLDNYLDPLVVSMQARAHKPLKPVFDLALQRAGVKAEQAWLVGDHIINDVAGAIRAGMTGVYYNPNRHNVEQAFVDIIERPDYTINRHSELLDLL